jgi:hypothetical protein
MAKNVLTACDAYIQSRDIDQFQSTLSLLPLDSVPQKTFDDLFVRFIFGAYEAGAVEIASYITDTWMLNHAKMNDSIPFDTYCFFLNLGDEVLQWLMLVVYIDYTSSMYHLNNLLKYDPSYSTLQAAYRVIEIYGNSISLENAKALEERARDLQNGLMEEFFQQLKSQLLPFAPKPKWVNSTLEILPTEEEILEKADQLAEKAANSDVVIMSVEDATELMTEGLSRQGISTQEMEYATEFIETMYRSLTSSQKINLLADSQHTKNKYFMSNDRELFRFFGPTNMLVGVDLISQNHECCKYGGCRMLICRCTVQADDDPDGDLQEYDDEIDWFTGSCQQCGTPIQHKWYAVRLPLKAGSWNGCYCSFKCVEMEVSDPLEAELLKINKANINEIGIQNRVSDDETRD